MKKLNDHFGMEIIKSSYFADETIDSVIISDIVAKVIWVETYVCV